MCLRIRESRYGKGRWLTADIHGCKVLIKKITSPFHKRVVKGACVIDSFYSLYGFCSFYSLYSF